MPSAEALALALALQRIAAAPERGSIAAALFAAAQASAGVERGALILASAGELRVIAALVEGECLRLDQPLAASEHAPRALVQAVTAAGAATIGSGAAGREGPSCAYLPLIHGGTRAALYLEHPRPRWFVGARRALVELLAAQTAIALAGVELRESAGRTEPSGHDRANSAQLRAIIEATTTVVFLKDLEGRYILVNRQLELDTGLSREQMLGKTDFELFAPATAERLRADDRRVIETGEAASFEGVTQFPSGARSFLSTKFPVRDAKGQVYAVGGLSTDITNRKRSEEQLRHIQRMNAIGQLAGGIAHDFNNMLAGISAAADLLEMQLPAPRSPTIADTLATIVDGCERAAVLTRELLAFSRKAPDQPEPVDLHAVIDASVGLLRRGCEDRIQINLHLGASDPRVTGDLPRLQGALLNLGLNAREAMPEGGTLTISTATVELSAEACAATPCYRLVPGPFIELRVHDTGVGIPKELRLQIFEPFFTTKAIGRGTGLAAVHGIVEEHGGAITVDSSLGRGTTFILYLPCAAQPISGRAPPATRACNSPRDRL